MMADDGAGIDPVAAGHAGTRPPHEHVRWMRCQTYWRCTEPEGEYMIGWGLGAMRNVAHGLMLFLGVDPKEHPAVASELESLVGDELLTLGRETLAGHNLLPPPDQTL